MHGDHQQEFEAHSRLVNHIVRKMADEGVVRARLPEA